MKLKDRYSRTFLHTALTTFATCALLVTPSTQLRGAEPAQPSLAAQLQGDKVALSWASAPGIRLQKASCVCPDVVSWQEIPGTETNCTLLVAASQTTEFYRVVDAFADTDGDFLTRAEEEAGWTIYVDTSGFCDPRIVDVRHVTSDPEVEDTDGDGLSDAVEWIIGTDPRADDTDRDGLSDYDEWNIWMTSPTSVDSDGDARGPDHNLPPSATLYDGNEALVLHTSPTLDDTDGDGRTDYEEYGQPGRNMLVAQLPKVEVRLVDALDVRLDVEYAEELGQTREYGSELKTSATSTDTRSHSWGVQTSLKIGAAAKAGFFDGGVGTTTEFTVSGSYNFTTEKSTADTTEKAISEYKTDSRTRTETAASGSISGGIQLLNNGPVTYTLTDFGVTLRYWSPGSNGTVGSFKTLATLVPALGANGIILAPGDSTPVLQVQATGLNASRVKEFMARPNSIYLEPAFYELENAEGLNFDYLEEVTRWRTARVEIDYGDGRNEEYRVATNVERNPEDGSYAGVTLGNVLNNMLHIPFQTAPRQTVEPGSTRTERVLTSLNNVDMVTPANGFWVVVGYGEGTSPANVDFENIVLHAGNQVLMMFVHDEDGDGLFAAEEQHYGTSDIPVPDSMDTDADGLSDVFEVRTGWDVELPTRAYHVYSDPRTPDQDGDTLTDAQEFALGTDPTKSDTDEDGIPDNLDPHPVYPASVLHVNADAPAGGDGRTWSTALNNLQDALSLARTGLASTNSDDDIAEIWVAAGVYKPSTNVRSARFDLVNNTCIYGGFSGYETKLSQRTPDPLINGTVLSGDLLDNDTSTYLEDPTSFSDNSWSVCYAPATVGPGTIIDGFTITGGCIGSWNSGGGMHCAGNPQLKNLLLRANHSILSGGALYITHSKMQVITDCLFLQNDSVSFGGGGMSVFGGTLFMTNCQFYANTTGGDGGGLFLQGAKCFIEGCSFRLNSVTNSGGAINIGISSAVRISRTQFEENTALYGGAIGTSMSPDGTNITMEVVQCVFFKNSVTSVLELSFPPKQLGWGPGINIGSASKTISLYVLNSTFCTNTIDGNASANGSAIDGYNGGQASVVIENSIIWGDLLFGSLDRLRVRTSCLLPGDFQYYRTGGNISTDPKFVDSANGNLQLNSDSPCRDRGNNYLDYEPKTPGLQLLPATDLDGNPRIIDGNEDGTPTVDMGAYEFQAR